MYLLHGLAIHTIKTIPLVINLNMYPRGVIKEVFA